MSYVLAIEANRDQARALHDVVGSSAAAKLLVVESVGSAVAAIEREVPRLILVNALLPPKDEGDLMDHVRTLPPHVAPEILITPAFTGFDRRTTDSGPPRGLFGRRQRDVHRPACVRTSFSDQVSAYLSSVETRLSRGAPVKAVEEVTEVVALALREPSALVPEPSGIDRRAAVRFEGVDWASARVNGTPVKVVDLSVTGAQILSPTLLRLGGSVHVMLSRGGDLVQCDAGIVWGAFEIAQATQAENTPFFRAGINFKDADRIALEQICFERREARPDGPRYEPREW